MKPVRYSKHALRTRRFWQVAAAEVLSAMSRPDKVDSGPDGTVYATRHLGKRFLRVTFREEPEYIIVLAIMPKLRG